jgi:hypothetical protein
LDCPLRLVLGEERPSERLSQYLILAAATAKTTFRACPGSAVERADAGNAAFTDVTADWEAVG